MVSLVVSLMVSLVVSLMVIFVMTRMVIAHHFAFPVQVPVVPSNGWCWSHIIFLLLKALSYCETLKNGFLWIVTSFTDTKLVAVQGGEVFKW